MDSRGAERSPSAKVERSLQENLSRVRGGDTCQNRSTIATIVGTPEANVPDCTVERLTIRDGCPDRMTTSGIGIVTYLTPLRSALTLTLTTAEIINLFSQLTRNPTSRDAVTGQEARYRVRGKRDPRTEPPMKTRANRCYSVSHWYLQV